MKSWIKYAVLVGVINVLMISYLVSDVMHLPSLVKSSGYWVVLWFFMTVAALMCIAVVNLLSLRAGIGWLKDSGKLTAFNKNLSTKFNRVVDWLDKDGF